MNRYRVLAGLAACAALTLLTGCATGESVVSTAFHDIRPDRIAVIDIAGDIRGNAPKNQVEDYFSMELMRKGYRVIERSRVDHLLKEQEFQRSDVTTTEDAARIGRILNIPAVAMIDVNVSGEKVSLTGRIVASETAEVLWIGSGRGGSAQTLATAGGAVAGGAAGSQVGSGTGTTAAIIAGGVLGGLTGQALAPQTSRVVQRAIKRMVRGLPPR